MTHKYVCFVVPSPDNTPSNPYPSHISIYKDCLKNGLRFLLHPFLWEALIEFEICPTKLILNKWMSLVAIWVSYHLQPNWPDLIVEEFQNLFQMKNATGQPRFCYTQSFMGAPLVGHLDTTKGWKKTWFYVGGDLKAPTKVLKPISP